MPIYQIKKRLEELNDVLVYDMPGAYFVEYAMNERIKEIWEKAAESTAAYPSGQNNSWETQVNFMEKFAELIVRECAQLILDKKMGDLGDNPGVKEWEEGYNEAVHDCYYLIRKHFGVEE